MISDNTYKMLPNRETQQDQCVNKLMLSGYLKESV